jgi:hypothetical protein
MMIMKRRTFSSIIRAVSLMALAMPAPLMAHVHWTRGNQLDSDLIALYHFDSHNTAPGDVLAVVNGLPANRGLTVGATAGAGTSAVHDTAESFLGPHSIRMSSTQDLLSAATVPNTDGDLTIEFWFKWDPTVTSQRVTVGLASTAKIVIARDTINPTNDRFGIEFTHGDYVSAPGFTNWEDVGDEEASLGEWRHYAVTIHSTGMTYDPVSNHDKYNADTEAIFWLNGHATGSSPHKVSLEGMQVHDASRIRIRNTNGTIFIDEFTIWAKDWAQNGAVHHPFSNGRGVPPSWEIDSDGDGYSDAYEVLRGWNPNDPASPPRDGSSAAIAANLLGDINGDGFVNEADVQALAHSIANGDPLEVERVAITQDDGVATVRDVTALGGFVSGTRPILR